MFWLVLKTCIDARKITSSEKGQLVKETGGQIVPADPDSQARFFRDRRTGRCSATQFFTISQGGQMQERFLTSVKEILRERLAMEQEEDLQDPERLPGDMLSVALTPARLREADKSLPPR